MKSKKSTTWGAPLLICGFLTWVLITAPIAHAQQKASPGVYKNPEADSLFQQALAHEDAGRIGHAIQTYRQLLRVEPNDPHAMTAIAGLYGLTRDFQKEIYWAREAIKADPRFYRAYINLGNAMALTGNVKNAESAFKKATELQPTNPLGYYSLGLLAEQQGNLEAAVALYRKSVEADPEFANGYFNLGAIHANAGDYEKAIEAMNMVLKLQPHAQDARRMLRQIQQEQAKQQR